MTHELRLTYVGGPTVLLEWGGLRLLTDPTFDPAGSEYRLPSYVLRKTQAPALPLESLESVDAVLLSHDHHFDNLDRAGRLALEKAGKVLTTQAGASRLGGRAIGFTSWQSVEMLASNGRILRVTATPARHGPPDGDRGPVTGFALAFADAPERFVYVSGDTVWFEGVREVSRRFAVKVAVLFMGAAHIPEVGPAHLTMTAAEGVEAARAFAGATIVPVHCEGWEHFSESRLQIEETFAASGLTNRLQLPERGRTLNPLLS
jgi:L-ascorbate metabolism protein UlaG (beta-lactamase superfamily)